MLATKAGAVARPNADNQLVSASVRPAAHYRRARQGEVGPPAHRPGSCPGNLFKPEVVLEARRRSLVVQEPDAVPLAGLQETDVVLVSKGWSSSNNRSDPAEVETSVMRAGCNVAFHIA